MLESRISFKRRRVDSESKWKSNVSLKLISCRLLQCFHTFSPIDFIYRKDFDKYAIDEYATDEEILAKVQTGKGDTSIFEGNLYIYIESVFAGT